MPVSQGVQGRTGKRQHGTLTLSLHAKEGSSQSYSLVRGTLIADGVGALHELIVRMKMAHPNPTIGLPGAEKHRNRYVESSGK